MAEGGPPDSETRNVMGQAKFVNHRKVDDYLLKLRLCENSDLKSLTTKVYSPASTIKDLEISMRKHFEIPEEKEVRLWNHCKGVIFKHLSKSDNTLQGAGLYQGQVIVIEPKNEDGTWPRQAKNFNSMLPYADRINSSSRYSSGSSYSSSYSKGPYGSSYGPARGNCPPGLCGLANLGNTSYMNAAIQCLSNVANLTQFMVDDQWKNELNEDNPLGTKGEIARSYADLVRQIWSGNYTYTEPRNFKVTLGKFAPQFAGSQLQDLQELMVFLLDGLHQDLNRIRKKPYIEQKDAEGRQDKELANEAWKNYRKRNDSVIVDTFHGLLKSTLVCSECAKVSVTFDPFCYLSLPLPIKKERSLEVFLVPLDPMRKPIQYQVTVRRLGNVADLCAALSNLTGIPSDKMVVTDVYNHQFHKLFGLDEPLSHILDRDDIFIYEVPVSSPQGPDTLILLVYMRERKTKGYYNNHVAFRQLFGLPLLMPVPRKDCTYDTLYNLILSKMRRYVTPPEPSAEWWLDDKQNTIVNGVGIPSMEVNDDNEETQLMDNDPSSSTSGEHKPVNEDWSESKHRLFSLSVINSYGSAEFDTLQDDDKPLKLTNRSCIAIDWHLKAKEKFFCENAAEDFDRHESAKQKNDHKEQVIQLDDCLELFTTKEKLGENDPWYCPKCKKHQQSTRKFELWSLPDILVIHLKRFSYSKYGRDKIDVMVEFPIKGLPMKKYILNRDHGPAIYDLIAVSNHHDGGMGGEHYTVYAQNKDDNKWYDYDDSIVTQSNEDSVVRKAPYVLIYQQRGCSNIISTPTDAGSTEGSSDESDTN